MTIRVDKPLLLFLVALLSGCAATQEIGRNPALSPVDTGNMPDYKSARAYPPPPLTNGQRFSLWNDRQSRLFTDPRALSYGDILTVFIAINDKAQFKNESSRNRIAKRTLGLSADVDIGPAVGSGTGDLSINSGSNSVGTGATARSEAIRLSIAAVVTDVLPNGNLLITGSQEVRVNAELRVLTIAGVVRPNDIGANNTIPYERIAEARVSYGGRGRLTEVQQPPYGQQIIDRLSPF